MRPLENIILLTLMVALAWSLVPPHRRARALLYMPLVTLVLIVVHAIIEGLRWQMLPVYALTAFLTVNNLRILQRQALPSKSPKPWLRLIGVVLAIVGFLIISQVPVILPVFKLPEPGGPYPVGTASLVLADSSREETFTSDPNDSRSIPIQVWYPAQATADGKTAPYFMDLPKTGRYIAGEVGLPFFFLDHLHLVKTHAIAGAKPVQQSIGFPVLVFSHGYHLGYLQQNTAVMEALASSGYIVFSVAHPYEAVAAPLVDGSTAVYLREFKDAFYDQPKVQEQSLLIWADDVRFLLDRLEDINAGEFLPQLKGLLALDRLGIFGMSFGGSTASLICLEDTRCKAGLTLDSPQYNAVKTGSLPQPFLFMVSANGEYSEREVYASTTGPAYLVSVADTAHYNFSDFTLVSPLASALGFSGPINGDQMIRIQIAYTQAFFDRHLKDLPGALLDGTSNEFPEVTIESRNTD